MAKEVFPMKILYLVTGAAGHLGSAVVRALRERGEAVRALVLPGDPAASRLPSGTAVKVGNVLDIDSLKPFFDAPQDTALHVLHCAGIVSTAAKPPPLLHAVNVEGTRNLVRLCRERQVGKLVHVSSVHAIPYLPDGREIREIDRFDPERVEGPYAKSKAEATALVLDAAAGGLDASIVFPSGICGPWDYGFGNVTRIIAAYVRKRLPMGVSGGFDFVDVRDVADGMLRCAACGRTGEGYILGNRYIDVPEMFGLFRRYLGGRSIRFYAPPWLAHAALPLCALADRIAKRPPLYDAYSLDTLTTNARYSHEKAARELGYVVRPFDETVRDTIAWLRDEGLAA